MYSSTLRELLSQIAAAVGLSVVLGFFSAGPLFAWDGKTHSLITRLALQNDPLLRQQVQVEPIEDFLAATEYKTAPAFIKTLRLNPSMVFPFKVPKKNPDESAQQPEYEKPGEFVATLDVLSTYVNEPDWGMDREICRSYPGYCDAINKDYKPSMSAFRRGLPSQAFRHMYWPAGYVKLFWMLFPKRKCASLGEAPERSRLFFDLSARAAQTGHPYWAARLLAWSMHYAQDVTQPFHAAQLPSEKLKSKKFIFPSVRKTVKNITYYHLAFEEYISLLLAGEIDLGELGESVRRSLQQSISDAADLPQRTALETTRAAAEHSISENFAKRTALAAIQYFPPFPKVKNIEKHLQSDLFKEAVRRRFQSGPVLDEFVAIARACLAEGSAASRTLVALFRQQTRPKTSTQPIPSGELQNRLDALSHQWQ